MREHEHVNFKDRVFELHTTTNLKVLECVVKYSASLLLSRKLPASQTVKFQGKSLIPMIASYLVIRIVVVFEK